MNILFATLAYHPDDIRDVAATSRDGLQNQIQTFQWSLIQGIRESLNPGETLSILNALPVGVFPRHYRKLVLHSKIRPNLFQEIGCLNLPWFKQRQRMIRAEKAMEKWIKASPENRTILVYTVYLPYLEAVTAVKRRHPEVQTCVIITDLPNELGIASGRKGVWKQIEYRRGNRSLQRLNAFDRFVLLAEPMASALPLQNRPYLVMEGLVSDLPQTEGDVTLPADRKPSVLYTGTLNRELGIGMLLDAFREMGEAQLWLCGKGDMEAEIQHAEASCGNIHYFGFVPQAVAFALQAKADVLVNPRTSQGTFTKYSFPSKTMEYLRSGKPVLCCKLEGIPNEYDAYLRYIEPQTAQGLRDAIRKLLVLSAQERAAIGASARNFVLTEKNSRVQSAKLLQFLRETSDSAAPEMADPS